jgi:hypothetical protein
VRSLRLLSLSLSVSLYLCLIFSLISLREHAVCMCARSSSAFVSSKTTPKREKRIKWRREDE